MRHLANIGLIALALAWTAVAMQPRVMRDIAYASKYEIAAPGEVWEIGVDIQINAGAVDPRHYYVSFPTEQACEDFLVSEAFTADLRALLNALAQDNPHAIVGLSNLRCFKVEGSGTPA